MKVTIKRLSHEGDSATVLENEKEIEKQVKGILAARGTFLAVQGEVVTDFDLAMDMIRAVEEAELIVGKQVAGG